MIASLVFERPPLTLDSLVQGGGLQTWVQTVGAIAALPVVVYMILRASGLVGSRDKAPPPWMPIFWLSSLAMLLSYLGAGVLAFLLAGDSGEVAEWMPRSLFILLTAGGAFAILAVTLDFWAAMTRLRPRRVWALARLSFKEAIRRKVLYVFGLFLLLFLFASWFMPYKPEDQLRNYVVLVFVAMTPILLFSSGLLSSFSIPTDIRTQTIHTVLTKPVERFEVVLGRILGYSMLMTLVLVILTTLSLGFVLRGVNNPEAAAESLKARVPLYGDLTFESTNEQGLTRRIDPENVGREWDYRGYVSGPMRGKPMQFAVWSYPEVPAELAQRKDVRCEFSFDVYRTTKGEENRGVNCTFIVESWRARPSSAQEYDRDPRRTQAAQASDLAEELGYHEARGKTIFDYRTLDVDVPAGVFKNHLVTRDELKLQEVRFQKRVNEVRQQRQAILDQLEPLRRRQEGVAAAAAAGVLAADELHQRRLIDAVALVAADLEQFAGLEADLVRVDKELAGAEDRLRYTQEDESRLAKWEEKGEVRPPLRVRVRCNTPNQFVGMAKYDFYLRADDATRGTDTMGFALNFYKAALGLWLKLILLISLCVFLSTELGGIISFLFAAILYIGGLRELREFLEDVVQGTNAGGGPLEAFFRLAKRENIVAPLEETTTTKVATGSDVVFRWIMRRVMNVLPDVSRFDFTNYVANGFDIALFHQDLFPAFLLLIGYLFPWAVIAYYLIKAREIAGPH